MRVSIWTQSAGCWTPGHAGRAQRGIREGPVSPSHLILSAARSYMGECDTPISTAELRRLTTLGAALFGLFLCIPLGAQPAENEPARPRLEAGADTNDWGSYHELGVHLMFTQPQKAADAFYWASRLDPGEAGPLYYQWRALWMSNPALRRRYFRGDRKALASVFAQRANAMRLRATFRDPFVLAIGDPAALERGPSTDRTREYLLKRPDDVGLWMYQAINFYRIGGFDSTIAQIKQAIAALDRIERKAPTRVYESREFFEYAIGAAYMSLGDPKAAREAFERSVSENVSFYPARAAIAAIAWSEGSDIETAVREYELATELNPSDGFLRQEYGATLLVARRFDEAVTQLERAIEMEPHFANIYLNLGIAYDHLGKDQESLGAYRRFVALAPRRMQPRITRAKARVEELTQLVAATTKSTAGRLDTLAQTGATAKKEPPR